MSFVMLGTSSTAVCSPPASCELTLTFAQLLELFLSFRGDQARACCAILSSIDVYISLELSSCKRCCHLEQKTSSGALSSTVPEMSS